MKKIYFSALAIFAGIAGLNAQVLQQPQRMNLVESNFKPVQNTASNEDKALGFVFYTNNFDNAADWVIDNDGQVGANYGWNINNTSQAWWSAFQGGMTSSSGGDYAEVQNGNYNNNDQALNVTYTMTLATALNVPSLSGGISSVSLQFEQWGSLFNDAQTVEVSTNNGTVWTEVYTNADKTPYVGNNPSAIYANPEVVTVNIADAISADPTNVLIRFVWTSRNPAAITTGWWTTFGWYIDDVKLMTNPDNDLATANPYWGRLGLDYNQIPNTQLAPLDFTVEAINNGLNPQTNAQLNVDITGAVTNSFSSTGITVAPNTTENLDIVAGFTPTVNGTYNIGWDISQTEVDDVPANDVIASESFQVVDYIWARDKGNTPTGTFNNAGIGYKLGNLFDMVNDQMVYSVQTRISNTSTIGAEFQAKIYWLPSSAATLDDMVEVGFSDFIEVAAGNVNQIIDIPLLAPVVLGADSTIFVAIESAGDAGATNGVVISTTGTADVQTVFLYDEQDADWFYTTNIPIIRLNFEENGIGIKENAKEIGLNVYPNPAKDEVNISFNLADAANASVKVIDVTGKEVAAQSSANAVSGAQNFTINTSNFAAGVYTVVVEHNNGTNTTKFIKK